MRRLSAWRTSLGALRFRCDFTGQEFRSAFQATPEDLAKIPAEATMELRCEVCRQRHTFQMSQCSIDDE